MLAAAGGPEVDPQADSDPEQKATWARNLARFDEDIARLEAFFLDVAAGKLSDEERRQQGLHFHQHGRGSARGVLYRRLADGRHGGAVPGA